VPEAVRNRIAAVLIAKGWRFRRGSTAPWIPPAEAPPTTQQPGYSLLGAAARQAEPDRVTEPFERHAGD
jgi:hypothetical protein